MELLSVTAMLVNNSPYDLKYESASVVWGNYYNKSTSVPPDSTLEIFYAIGLGGAPTGCQGTVTWAITDQNGNSQDITLTYKDTYTGPNSFGITVPSGMTGSATQPQGDEVTVTYTVGGSIS